jgi:fimbrial chaperone protein
VQRDIYRLKVRSLICLLSLLLLWETGWTANFSVSPVRLFFFNKNRTNILKIKNNSDESITLQLRAYEWRQNERGENLYSPTKDIVFFPKILTLKKAEEKIIRLGTKVPQGRHEKTYRLYIEEIPPPNTLESTAVRIIMKVGIPIFISPLEVESKGNIEKLELSKGKLYVLLKNGGNVHFIIKSVRLTGSDASGKEVFKTERGGGYLHGNKTKALIFDIPIKECLKIKTLRVVANTDRVSMSGKLDVHRKMCIP